MRLSGRVSLISALGLLAIGAFRFVTDTLHEVDPGYWTALADSPLRYIMRAPSDGSALGYLNAQWFKLLSIPAGISLIYLRDRFGSGSAREKEADFRDWAVRGVWIAVFFIGFTVIEIEKQFHPFGFATNLVAGETPALNHLAHVLSAWLAWQLSGMWSMSDDEATLPDQDSSTSGASAGRSRQG